MTQIGVADDQAARRRAFSSARRTELLLAGCIALVSLAGLAVHAVAVALLMNSVSQLVLPWAPTLLGVALLIVAWAGMPVVAQNVIPRVFEREQLRAIAQGQHQLSALTPYDLARVAGTSVFVPLLLAGPLAALLMVGTRGTAGALLIPSSVFLFLYSFAYHRVPNSRRSVKYAAFMTGGALVGACVAVGKQPEDDGVALTLLGFAINAACCAVMWARIRPTEPLIPADASTARARNWRRLSMTYGPQAGVQNLAWFVIKAIPILGDVFWAARIFSKQRLARAPVLYLRSFSHHASALLLGKVVTPAVSRVSVVAALVHPSQTTAALNEKTHEAWTPLTLGVSNETWQTWYLRQLPGALAVVVDAGILSEHTRWELDNALRVLGRDRVIVLTARGTASTLPPCKYLEYDLERLTYVRDSLTEWIDDLMDSMFRPSIGASEAGASARTI